MREIEFRGLTEQGGWVYGPTVYYENDGVYIVGRDISHIIKVIPETVGQYIGKKDKTDKKIFEGDILDYIDMCDCNSLVVWSDYMGGWFLDNEDDYQPSVYKICKDYEIIGNIHQNPELLE